MTSRKPYHLHRQPSMEGWTQERAEQLTKLWADGLSATAIVQHMPEFTRNAIIGKARRLDLPMRITKVRSTAGVQKPTRMNEKHATPRHATKRLRQLAESLVKARTSLPLKPSRTSAAGSYAAKVAPIFPVEPLPVSDPVVGGIALENLEHWMCRFPVTDGLPHLFCGEEKVPGSSYCGDHKARCCAGSGRVNLPRYLRRAITGERVAA